ncbi:MAG: hypothetical protein SGARI_008039, partial [Bacillariaceae sp.]
GNVPRDWPGFDFDPATASLSTPQVQKDGLAAGVTAAIVLVTLIVVALIALLVIRKKRNGRNPDAAQNAARDPSEALKLEADGGVLQEIVSQSFSRTPNSTPQESVSGNGYGFEHDKDEEASIEVERPKSPLPSNYSDNPNGKSRKGRRSVNEYGGNIL